MTNYKKRSIGEVLKEIRMNSSITVNEACNYGGIMTRGHLYKVENCEVLPDLNKITSLLQNFSISLEEFDFLRRKYKWTHSQETLLEFRKIQNSLHTNQLQDLLKKLEKKETKSSFSKNMIYLLQGYIAIQKDQKIDDAKKYFNLIWSDLQKKETWYYTDIFFISHIFFIFEEETLTYILNQLLYYYKLYSGFSDINWMYRATLFNYCTFLGFNNEPTETEKILLELKTLAHDAKDSLTVLGCKFYLYIIEYYKTNDTSLTKKAMDIIYAIQQADEMEIAQDMLHNWNRLLQQNVKLKL
ncbi:helix-turn-helix domain-containing protein [Listeria fleischmannii]|uniref:helix-turn-helix domain-containing protein n=1 Tax=Listeria fleischmannii TaxID=1069827 RepID=UPI00162946BC|nr:helix-turn-helix transcriptional regulator [Listeria fleischmannii]MBC1417903.1 helix-turn-helix transcriptional regulator [Listeria fleischmannii]